MLACYFFDRFIIAQSNKEKVKLLKAFIDVQKCITPFSSQLEPAPNLLKVNMDKRLIFFSYENVSVIFVCMARDVVV